MRFRTRQSQQAKPCLCLDVCVVLSMMMMMMMAAHARPPVTRESRGLSTLDLRGTGHRFGSLDDLRAFLGTPSARAACAVWR